MPNIILLIRILIRLGWRTKDFVLQISLDYSRDIDTDARFRAISRYERYGNFLLNPALIEVI